MFAFTGIKLGGGYGELVVLPETYLGRVPASLNWAEAGTVPGVGATAYEAFTVHTSLKPGMRVFINGAAGGVGTYAIQIAKALGAEVTGTCSESKATLVRELGADHVVDYTKGDPFAAGHGTYDVVLDAVRGTSLARLRKLLRPGGVLVTINGYPWDVGLAWIRNLISSRRTVVFFVKTSGVLLDGLAKMIDDESAVLAKWARGRSIPARLVQRARIIRRAAEGAQSKDIAEELGVSRPTVQLWRERFLSLRLDGLE